MDGLHQKLESQGLRDVVYMVVNHQGEKARLLHPLLAQNLSENITLYKQEAQQPDVWQALGGEKDDFFIYDRCGRLTQHISLPYSIIGQGHVESAIKDTYCKRICGECTHESAEIPEECRERADAQPDADATPPVEGDGGHGHHHGHGHGHDHGHGHGNGHGNGHDHDLGHGHGHGHGRGHGHGHHGDTQGVHPRGFGHGHGQDNHRGHHGGDHGQHQSQQRVGQQEAEISQGQDQLDLGQMQQAVHMQQMPQEALGGPGRPWASQKARWKSKHSWQWTAGSDNGASPKTSWCWHWRRLFGDAGSEQPVGLWQCDEALPASWQWHGLTGDAANNVRETWQWRSPSAEWQQPPPAPWAWPQGVSWGWEQL